MTDREMLDLAAKAAGYKIDGFASKYIAQGVGEDDYLVINDSGGHSVWRPLTDDGDAFRLAIKLNIGVNAGVFMPYVTYVVNNYARQINGPTCTYDEEIPIIRRLIVEAAVKIGASK